MLGFQILRYKRHLITTELLRDIEYPSPELKKIPIRSARITQMTYCGFKTKIFAKR